MIPWLAIFSVFVAMPDRLYHKIQLLAAQYECIEAGSNTTPTIAAIDGPRGFRPAYAEYSDFFEITNSFGNCWIRRPSRCLRTLLEEAGTWISPYAATLFIGVCEDNNRIGGQRLLIVTMPYWGRSLDTFSDTVDIRIITPATLFQPATVQQAGFTPDYSSQLPVTGNAIRRFDQGYVDPDDKSHFYIPYRVDDQHGVIEGRLRNGIVTIWYRYGPGFSRDGRTFTPGESPPPINAFQGAHPTTYPAQ